MDPITLTTIGTFTWNALSGGIFYDKVKPILGSGLGRLQKFCQDEKKDEFMSTLEMLLEYDEELLRNLKKLEGSEKSGDSFHIETGNINAEGSVVIGYGNSIEK
ncbi:hypothetical protein [Veronia pacifica]|uniref:Uncharacterized protein n=1 Tax=Veronia pacifica TaxID=1080227 RepID=A0A1C3E6Z0_9GAMM|nr:hypothetical protein [Veronia pacifica]ODA29018.1 hypothetical protein A8L45_22885 [Veronia pacifica]